VRIERAAAPGLGRRAPEVRSSPLRVSGALVLAAVAGALGAAACVRAGRGARSGKPIDAGGQARELVACQSVRGDEHARTEVVATTLDGLDPLAVASQPGQESGVRGHPLEPDVVVFARQTRRDDPTSKELFVSSLDRRFIDVRLTRDGDSDCEPCWLPDGGRVVFASDRGGTFALWGIGRDGRDLAPITQPVAGASDHAPDARAGRLVFARVLPAPAPRSTLWIMNTDGSGETQLTAGGPGGVASAAAGFVPGDHEPALAPDGGSVVFVRRTAEDRATLMRLELAPPRLVEVSGTRDGEDRFPRFTADGSYLVAARTSPGDGLLGRRLVAMRLDGQDVAQVGLDERLACQGLDFLAGARAWPRPVATATTAELSDDDARILLGRRTLGRFAEVRRRDGAGLQLSTEPYSGLEKAAVFLPFELPLSDPSRVARVRVVATFSLTVAEADARVRISVEDYERDRFDVAWNQTVPDTGTVEATFTFASLAHVDRDGWIRVELVAELPEGVRGELALDAVTVEAFVREP